ncbi:MAG: hypothetical protein KJ927_05740 [Candidatus Eisenbacteria bacterium]|nr:hypothetical protein [Candidatus Eisenbacteria bacterium]
MTLDGKATSILHNGWDTITKCLKAILDVVLPPQCPLCRTKLDTLGAPCSCVSLPPGGVRDAAFCRAASDPLPSAIPLIYGAEFRGPVRDLIHIFKYQGLASAREVLAGKLAEEIKRSQHVMGMGGVDLDWMVVVPVPPHPARVRERGWDHSGELASSVARRLNLPQRRLLCRKRWTSSLTKLGEDERRMEVAGAFALTRLAGRYRGRPLLLIDDVFTTGATLTACLTALEPLEPPLIRVAVAAWTPRRFVSQTRSASFPRRKQVSSPQNPNSL